MVDPQVQKLVIRGRSMEAAKMHQKLTGCRIGDAVTAIRDFREARAAKIGKKDG